MIQLNLLPDVKKEFLRAQSFRAKTISLSILITIAAVALTAVLASYVYGAQTLFSNWQKGDIKEMSKELKGKKDISKYLTLQNQLSTIDGLHDEKAVSSRIFEILPRLNPVAPNNVKFASVKFSAAETQLTFQGGVKDFSALTTFQDTLKDATLSYLGDDGKPVTEKLFDDVTILQSGFTSSSTPDVAVGFTIQTVYNTKLLANTTKNVTIAVPNMETTHSVIASPQLFQENAGALNGQ